MRYNLFFFFIIFSSLLTAQTAETVSSNRTLHLGTEVDIFPFLNKGYYCSVIAGTGNMQGRFVYAKAEQPGFVLPKGFHKNQMHVYAFIFDYFLNTENNAHGFWVGGGFEIWNNSAQNSQDLVTGTFTNYVATFGAGYNYYLSEYIYINPWTAIHAIAGGEKSITIGSRKYRVKTILPELSLKIGLRL